MANKEISELTAVSHTVESIGKLFSDSKTRHTWAMDVDGETHVLVVTASWNSGKFVVEFNGFERFNQVTPGAFVYSFKFRDRYLKIHAKGETLVLLIDTLPFETFSRRAKAAQAEMLKSYERTASSPSRQLPSAPPAPFSGNLAKRLGKEGRSPSGYVEQPDEDDMFATPVDVKLFVPANARTVAPEVRVAELTVVPDLIEFHSEPSQEPAPTTPVPDGVVTPRDQISPHQLENPFAAFDELAAEKRVN